MYKFIFVQRPSSQLFFFFGVLGPSKDIYVLFALPEFLLFIVKFEIGIGINDRWRNGISERIEGSVTFPFRSFYFSELRAAITYKASCK